MTAAPLDLELRLRRAETRRRAGDAGGALSDLVVASQVAPKDPRVLSERGLARRDLGDVHAALGDLDAYLIAAGPRPRVDALEARAEIHATHGRTAAALADLDAAVRIAPGPDVCLRRGALLESSGRLGDALRSAVDCLDVLGDAVVLRLAVVRLQRLRGAPAQALAEVDSLLAARPDHAPWLVLRAAVLTELGLPDEARADLESALEAVDRRLARRNTAQRRVLRAEILTALAGAL